MATKQHSTLTGSDLHLNKIDATTGTELTTASQTTYDARWLKQTGGTITPTSNSTTTVAVNRQDGTTPVLTVDTTNNRVQVGNGSTGTLRVGDASISKAGGSLWSMGATSFTGNIALVTRTVTAAYSMVVGSDNTVLADAAGGAFTVTLPSAGGASANAIYIIKRLNSGANAVTVGTTSSQTIDGATTKTLGAQYATILVQSNGSNWFIISTFGTVT